MNLGLDERASEHVRGLLKSQPFVRELQDERGGLRLYVERGEEALPAILRTLDRAEIGLSTVSLSRPTLDDVFLRQTGRSLREAGEPVEERIAN